jgi:hypothetical protein
VLILALVAIPVAILSYFSQPDITKMLTDFQKVLAIPPGHRDQAKPIFDQMNASALGPVAALTYLLQLLVGPLAVTACVIAIARSYRGEPTSVGDAYRSALGRWLAQIVTAIVFIAIYIGVVIAVSLASVAVVIASAFVYVFSHAGGFIVGIPLGIAVIAAYIASALLLFLAWQLAVISIATEEPDPARAVSKAFRRTFARPVFWRSLLVGLVVVVVQTIGSIILLACGGLLAAATHTGVLFLIVASIGSITLQALVVCYLVVYSFDIRLRREGYDLTLATQT